MTNPLSTFCACCTEKSAKDDDKDSIDIHVHSYKERSKLLQVDKQVIPLNHQQTGDAATSKDVQKAVLKKIVKQFFKEAQIGIPIAFWDWSTMSVQGGVFRLGSKLQDLTIVSGGEKGVCLSYPVRDITNVAKFDSPESVLGKEDAKLLDPEISRGVGFFFKEETDGKSLLLAFDDEDEQFKFYAACNVVRHLSGGQGKDDGTEEDDDGDEVDDQ